MTTFSHITGDAFCNDQVQAETEASIHQATDVKNNAAGVDARAKS